MNEISTTEFIDRQIREVQKNLEHAIAREDETAVANLRKKIAHLNEIKEKYNG